jgi:hypothetical protein
MSENAKFIALLLLLIMALGVVGDMDYEDARRSEQARPNVELWLQRSAAAAIPPNPELLENDGAAKDECLNVDAVKTNDVPAACDGSQPVR